MSKFVKNKKYSKFNEPLHLALADEAYSRRYAGLAISVRWLWEREKRRKEIRRDFNQTNQLIPTFKVR